jgi:hypothetical protein
VSNTWEEPGLQIYYQMGGATKASVLFAGYVPVEAFWDVLSSRASFLTAFSWIAVVIPLRPSLLVLCNQVFSS